ncbi:MAG: hypothetical protein JWP69_1244 [Flaviaesturariibacter sp.]|nr:hypothetical protein [Flaviaesturariibacter sp.]
MIKRISKQKPLLSKSAFWDADLSSLDFDRYERFIITRVFERGSESDQQALLSYYGAQKIRSVLINMPTLQPIAREWAKRLLHLSDADFKCCKNTLPLRNSSRY